MWGCGVYQLWRESAISGFAARVERIKNWDVENCKKATKPFG